MNKPKTNWQEIALIIGGIVLYVLYLQSQDQKKQIKFLESKLEDANQLSKEIKDKLQAMIESNSELDEDVKHELAEAAALLEIKQESKAVLTLAKIIESLLIKLYKKDEKFKVFQVNRGKKHSTFHDYLEFAKDEKIISIEDYHYISALKYQRNKEAHELIPFKEKAKLVGCFLAGLTVTISLQKIIRKTF